MKKLLKILGSVLGLALIIVLVFSLLYPNAAHAIWKNLTAYTIDLDESTDWAGGKAYVGVPYSEVSESCYVDIYVPSDVENPPLFVLIHGGGFIANDSQSRQAQLMYRYFRDHGYACATVNYRLAQEEPFPGAVEDCKCCIRYLRAHASEYGFDASKIAVWGESAGGYLATACALTNDDEFNDEKFIGQDELGDVSSEVAVLVDYYGAVELTQKDEDWKTLGIPQFIIKIANSWLSGDVLEGYKNVECFWLRNDTETMTEEELAPSNLYTYVNENLSGRQDLAIWIAHGDCDITVPILQSERFYEAVSALLPADQVVFNIVEGSGHAGDIMYTDSELQNVKNFLDIYLN